MKKLILIFILTSLLIFNLIACSDVEPSEDKDFDNSRFEIIDSFEIGENSGQSSIEVFIIRDIATDILYMYTATYRSGGLNPLLDANGVPMTYANYFEKENIN